MRKAEEGKRSLVLNKAKTEKTDTKTTSKPSSSKTGKSNAFEMLKQMPFTIRVE
jgi:hypothetical protein